MLRLDPDNIPAPDELASVLGKDGHYVAKALSLPERAYQEAPGSATVVDTLGWFAARRGGLDRAVTLIRPAVPASAGNSTLPCRLAVVMATQEKKEKASKELQ